MARIAVLAIDIPHANRYKGDPVAVEEDDHTFEDDDSYGVLFYVLDIPGKTKAQMQRVMEPRNRPALPTDPEWNNFDAADRVVNEGPHRWNLDFVNKMPANERTTLKTGKLTKIPGVAEINSYFTDRVFGGDLLSG